MRKKRVIIDADPATGVPFRDVDDGLAILFLLASPEVHLEGITVNFGNVNAEKGTEVAKKLLHVTGKDVPVFTGAASKKQLGTPNPAVDYLIDTVNSNPGEISLLAVAPLTNVASAMMLDAHFAENLAELVIMGGSIDFGIFAHLGEFNFHLDGMAASIVINTDVPKTLITMDVISKAVFTDTHLDILKKGKGTMNNYIVNAIEPWLRLNRKVFFKKKGFFPWDPVAAACMVDKTMFNDNYVKLNVQPGGIRSGRITSITSLDIDAPVDGKIPVNMPLELDSARFMDLFINRLASYQ